jgi:hypothetical protein
MSHNNGEFEGEKGSTKNKIAKLWNQLNTSQNPSHNPTTT